MTAALMASVNHLSCMKSLASETESDFEEAVQRTTFGHPFLTEYTFNRQDDGRYKTTFTLVRPINDSLLRKLGEELYESLRDSGYLVNVNLHNQTDAEIVFHLEYSGVQIK